MRHPISSRETRFVHARIALAILPDGTWTAEGHHDGLDDERAGNVMDILGTTPVCRPTLKWVTVMVEVPTDAEITADDLRPTHVLERTTPAGTPFLGRCRLCGEEGLARYHERRECSGEPATVPALLSCEAF